VGLQLPEQHCESAVQTVDPPRQQTLFTHDKDTFPDEQQSLSATQVPPKPLHAHAPLLPQTPVQHGPALVHGVPVSSQQRPLLAILEQQATASPLMPEALLPRFTPSAPRSRRIHRGHT